MMLARVKWRSTKKPNLAPFAHGTLLQFLSGHDTITVIAADGDAGYERGEIVQLHPNLVRVTSWFKWSKNE